MNIRTIATFLVATALVGVPAASASAAPRFSDVPANHAFATEISWLADSGISTGYSDGTYRPGDPVRRDAMAAFIYRLAGQPDFTPPAVSPFRDVRPSDEFYREITWLATTGITTGYADDTYRPLDPVNRDAMAAFLYRYSDSPAYTPPANGVFWDVPNGTQFFTEITWLAGTGVSTGYNDGTGCRAYQPLDAVSREAMAAFIYRLELGGGTPITTDGCVYANPAAGQDVTRQLLQRVNAARAAVGAAPLRYNATLVHSACGHSTWMMQTGSFQHSSSGPWRGENIAWGYRSVDQVFQGWMDSPGHRANILRTSFTTMGGCLSTSGYYWTQQFA